MRRILVMAILFLLSSVGLLAAKNSQTFYLATTARAGDVQLPRGIYEVTWDSPSGSRVRLTIKSEDDKTVNIFARVVEGRQNRTGVVTSIVDGITYLEEFHTSNARFMLQNRTGRDK